MRVGEFGFCLSERVSEVFLGPSLLRAPGGWGEQNRAPAPCGAALPWGTLPKTERVLCGVGGLSGFWGAVFVPHGAAGSPEPLLPPGRGCSCCRHQEPALLGGQGYVGSGFSQGRMDEVGLGEDGEDPDGLRVGIWGEGASRVLLVGLFAFSGSSERGVLGMVEPSP